MGRWNFLKVIDAGLEYWRGLVLAETAVNYPWTYNLWWDGNFNSALGMSVSYITYNHPTSFIIPEKKILGNLIGSTGKCLEKNKEGPTLSYKLAEIIYDDPNQGISSSVLFIPYPKRTWLKKHNRNQWGFMSYKGRLPHLNRDTQSKFKKRQIFQHGALESF